MSGEGWKIPGIFAIPMTPRYLWVHATILRFLEFARGYRIFRGLDRTGVILRGITLEQVDDIYAKEPLYLARPGITTARFNR